MNRSYRSSTVWTFLVPMFVLSAVVSGCAGWPKAPSKAEPRMVYVWPSDLCPSQANAAGTAHVASIIGAIATTLIGNTVNAVLGIPAAALNAAAAADKEGFKMAGTNARYYYSVVEVPDPANKAQMVPALAAPDCYVVAVTQPVKSVNPDRGWCDDTAFRKTLPGTCSEDGKKILKSLLITDLFTKEGLRSPAVPAAMAMNGLQVPEFYAEIAFHDSSFDEIALPTVAALYYPRSLLAGDTEKARTVALGINIASPITQDPFKAAALAIVLPAVKPGEAISHADLARLQTGWVSRPTRAIPVPSVTDLTSIRTNAGRYLPVTMMGTFSEVGDPSVFLATFAAAFGSPTNINALTTSAMNSFSVTGGPSVNEQQLQQAQINLTKAVGAALTSQGQLLKLCSSATPLSPADKATARGLFDQTISSQLAANLAAEIAFAPAPFGDPRSVTGVAATCWQ